MTCIRRFGRLFCNPRAILDIILLIAVNFAVLTVAGCDFKITALIDLFIIFTVFAVYISKPAKKSKLLIIADENSKQNAQHALKSINGKHFDITYELFCNCDEERINVYLKNNISNYDSVFISADIDEKIKTAVIEKTFEMDKSIYILPDFCAVGAFDCTLAQFNDTPVFYLKPLSLKKSQAVVKRVFDIVFSLFAILVTFPVMVLCALTVKLTSSGPVIYRQKRLTVNKKPFCIYKFRTMKSNAEKVSGPKLAVENDDRITSAGKFMRRYHLDELPQFFNILMGQMSVVGPRPERKCFVDGYLKSIDGYGMRFSVKAGLTGFAQVYGKYNTSIADKTIYDIMYIRNFSFLLDLKLIFLTIFKPMSFRQC